MAKTRKTTLPQPVEPTAREQLPPHYKAGQASDTISGKQAHEGPAERASDSNDPTTLSDVPTPAHSAEDARDQWIRQRAYEIWEREGRPDGHALDHWLRAQRDIAGQLHPEMRHSQTPNG